MYVHLVDPTVTWEGRTAGDVN